MSLTSTFSSVSKNGWASVGSTGYAIINTITTRTSPQIISTNNDGNYVGYVGFISATPVCEIWTRSGSTYVRQANVAISGSAFDISSNTTSWAAMGNPGSTLTNGSVTIMKRTGNTWTDQITSQTINGTQPNQRFGQTLQFSGDESKLVILKNDLGNANSIAIDTYTYNGTAWTLSNTIFNSNLSYVGAEIQVNETGNRYFVSSLGPSNYIEMYNTDSASWTQIIAANVPANSQFGSNISINTTGNILAVGAATANNSSNSFGKIYLFTESANVWTQKLELIPPDTPNTALYARMLSINNSGNTLITNLYKDDGSNDTSPFGIYSYDISNIFTTATLSQIITSPNSNVQLTYAMDLNSSGNLLYTGLNTQRILVYGR